MKTVNENTVLYEKIRQFIEFVHDMNGIDQPYDFTHRSKTMIGEEAYKAEAAAKARDVLECDKWNDEWISSGEISKRIIKAMDICFNLVFHSNKTWFGNVLNPRNKAYNPESVKAIYMIYKGNDEQQAFALTKRVFGAKYDILACLFFIKDSNRFLPVSPNNFDARFKLLGIPFKMSYRCSWENYCQYVEIMRNIQLALSGTIACSHEVRLIDAHSFVWLIGQPAFIKWQENRTFSGFGSGINTPLAPKDIIRHMDGSSSYVCGNCECQFVVAPRCPECGQLVKVDKDGEV